MMQISEQIGQEMEKLTQSSPASPATKEGPQALEAKTTGNSNTLRK
jgi:hypothetical protein